MSKKMKSTLGLTVVLCVVMALMFGTVSASPGYCYDSPGGIHDGAREQNMLMYKINSNGTKSLLGRYYKFTCTNCDESVYTEGKPGIQIGYYAYEYAVDETFGVGGEYVAEVPAADLLRSTAKYLPGWNLHF